VATEAETDLESELAAILASVAVPACPACGSSGNSGRAMAREDWLAAALARGVAYPPEAFRPQACKRCSHAVLKLDDGTVRDLTKAEAAAVDVPAWLRIVETFESAERTRG